MYTSRGPKRKVRIFEPSQAFDTSLSIPLNNPRFLCRSRPRSPWLLKGASNVVVVVIRALDDPEDLTHKPTAQMGLYAHRGQDKSKAC